MSDNSLNHIAAGAQARREGRLDDAYHAYEQAAETSRASGEDQCLITALAGLGQIERDRGHIEQAQQHYVDALALCRRQDRPLRTAHIARHLGDLYRVSGLAQQAEPLLTEAVLLYRQNLDTKVLDLANAIRPLALLKTAQGDVEGARPLWQEAQVLYSSVKVEAGATECSAQLVKLLHSP
jgi:tetratricopeptide (TPR) repeat protein